MRSRIPRRLAAAVLSIAFPLVSPSAEAPRPPGSPANPGFEETDPAGRVAGWSAAQAASAVAAVASDRQVRRGGAASLRVRHAAPSSSTIASGPVRLEVGRLYRLSAWVRTEAAFADPASRYPTAVAACLTMESFPFTNHSPTVGSDSEWTRVATLFIATRSRDRVLLHLGHNGTASGSAWFDDVALEPVDDVSAWVAPETVRWFGPAYRYDDRGWIFLHAEGEPYPRGYQHGALLPDEIVAYVTKLGLVENAADGPAGWRSLRAMADAILHRGFDEEYLVEMRGIADGATHAGAKYDGRPIDLLDIVTLNSVVDLVMLRQALAVTPNAISGRSFLGAEDELLIPESQHKCSAFAATGPATADGRIVFGQLFMWSGYTGVHWNVLCDLAPTSGHRLVYQTFPGGIHSGSDFYINSAGILIGETTTGQTPFDPTGTPQSNRSRKAAQYAASIEDAVRILRDRNNGLYTNDWPIADTKTDEIAIYLLGTRRDRLWLDGDDPFGTPGFLWSNNNNRDAGVRSEYAVQADGAPYDPVYSPWDRDLAFLDFYRRRKGTIDSTAAVDLWASSPVNRPHACDGKVTTSEMAEKLVFLAHYGKVTLREKFPEKGSRRMPDLPGAIPHLTLGYSTPSPIFVGDRLRAARAASPAPASEPSASPLEIAELSNRYRIDKRRLWRGTILPATTGDGWLASASAAYWRMLEGSPETPEKAADWFRDQLAELTCRYLYTVSREDDVVPSEAKEVLERYGHYRIPRVKGTFALHQLRLLLGNDVFLDVMRRLHERAGARPVAGAELISVAEEVSGLKLGPFVGQWVDRAGLPDPRPSIRVRPEDGGWTVTLDVAQEGSPYRLLTSVLVETGGKRLVKPVEVSGERTSVELRVPDAPTRVVFDPGNDIPAGRERFHGWSNFVDDWAPAVIVWGTSRQVEANHTLALRFQTTLADAFTETLLPVVRDSELSARELADCDLIVLGQPEDNSLTARLAPGLPAELGKNFFRWRGATYASPDDGLLLVLPSPFHPRRALYLFSANSALQLYRMTKGYIRDLPSWAIFKGEAVVERGYHPPARFELLPAPG